MTRIGATGFSIPLEIQGLPRDPANPSLFEVEVPATAVSSSGGHRFTLSKPSLPAPPTTTTTQVANTVLDDLEPIPHLLTHRPVATRVRVRMPRDPARRRFLINPPITPPEHPTHSPEAQQNLTEHEENSQHVSENDHTTDSLGDATQPQPPENTDETKKKKKDKSLLRLLSLLSLLSLMAKALGFLTEPLHHVRKIKFTLNADDIKTYNIEFHQADSVHTRDGFTVIPGKEIKFPGSVLASAPKGIGVQEFVFDDLEPLLREDHTDWTRYLGPLRPLAITSYNTRKTFTTTAEIVVLDPQLQGPDQIHVKPLSKYERIKVIHRNPNYNVAATTEPKTHPVELLSPEQTEELNQYITFTPITVRVANNATKISVGPLDGGGTVRFLAH